MEQPTRYARSGDLHIAYQEDGAGPLDLFYVPTWIAQSEVLLEEPSIAAFVQRLCTFARVVSFDRRGAGLSDPWVGLPTLEDQMDDVLAVMDATGTERAALMGSLEGGPLAMLFAATHPDRVDSPASPGTAKAVLDALGDTDVRHVLPSIRVPTLIMHRREDPFLMVEHSRYLAEHIPGARYVELEGSDSLFSAGDSESILGEIEEFLTGSRHLPEPDRVLATVMFTDIVGSTERAAELGDSAWRTLLERHDELVRAEVVRHRGRAVKSTGDGVLATFDGPARAIGAARSIEHAVHELGIQIRAGLHTGECELIGDDVGGMAVHIGARVLDKAEPGEVLVSSTVKDLIVGSGIHFRERGAHQLRGVPGEWNLYEVG